MSVLVYLVPVSLVLLGFAVWAFYWAVKRGQFDNLDTPAIDILAEDHKDAPLRSTAELRAARRAASTQADVPEPDSPEPGSPPDAD